MIMSDLALNVAYAIVDDRKGEHYYCNIKRLAGFLAAVYFRVPVEKCVEVATKLVCEQKDKNYYHDIKQLGQFLHNEFEYVIAARKL